MDFWQQFGGALNRLSHAYILACPDREILHRGAEFLASAYVCTGRGRRPCLQCAGCRKAAGGVHPDILETAPPPDKQGITVNQIRQLRQQAPILPNEAPRKVYILDHAHTMNDSGQNALLKLLEEGPPHVAFLLLVEHPQQLLPTIRSRCECLFLRPQGQGEEPDRTVVQAAQKLTELLLKGEELALAEYTVTLEREKWSGESLQALLNCLEEQLRPQARSCPHRLVPALEQIKRMRRGLDVHLGAGHLLGWLAAGSVQENL